MSRTRLYPFEKKKSWLIQFFRVHSILIPYLINLAPETQNHSKITKKAHEGFWKTLRNKFILLKNYVYRGRNRDSRNA